MGGLFSDTAGKLCACELGDGRKPGKPLLSWPFHRIIPEFMRPGDDTADVREPMASQVPAVLWAMSILKNS